MLGKTNSLTCTSMVNSKNGKRCGTPLMNYNGAMVCQNCDRLPSWSPQYTHRP